MMHKVLILGTISSEGIFLKNQGQQYVMKTWVTEWTCYIVELANKNKIYTDETTTSVKLSSSSSSRQR